MGQPVDTRGRFLKTVSLCTPGWPGTPCVDQTVLELTDRDPPAYASGELGLKVCAVTTQLRVTFLWNYKILCVV